MRKLSDDEKEDLRLARALEPMRRSEGWALYSKLLKTHKETHLRSILGPITSIETVLAGEREKGTVVGIDLALNLIETICSEAEKIRKVAGDIEDE